MKLLILGATGKTGSELVRQGLERGFEVTGLVRSPEKSQLRDRRLTIVRGSPLDEHLLHEIVPDCDAVLSTLGHLDLKESYVVTDGARTVVRVMKTAKAKRLMILSSTLVVPGGSFLTRLPRYITRHALNDSKQMEGVVEISDVAWTIVRLVRLTNGVIAPYRIFESEPPSVSATISRKSVAACMLDLVANESYFQKTIGICAAR